MEIVLSNGYHTSHVAGIFFDGQLEDLVGFDLVHLEQGELLMGMSMVTVKCEDGSEVEAIAYLYPMTHPFDDSKIVEGRFRGYIVLPTDGEANFQAREHMKNNSKCI